MIEELGARLERTRDNAVEPLYFSYDIEDLELRICFLVSNSWLFDQYIVTVLRSVAGVQASRVRLTLNGRVFEEGLSSLISDEGKPLSAHVFLHNGPEYDDAVWEALGELSSDHSGVRPVWMFRDFYEYDRAITLRLIGPSAPAIRGYLDERLGRIPGIASWRLQFMAGMVKIQSEERLMYLARLFSHVGMNRGSPGRESGCSA